MISRIAFLAVIGSLVLFAGQAQGVVAVGANPPGGGTDKTMSPAQRIEMMRSMPAKREAAAKKAEAAGVVVGEAAAGASAPTAGGTPDYFGGFANYANSALPTVDPNTGAITGGIRKFVDALPGLTSAGANNIGQYIPVANATANQNAADGYAPLTWAGPEADYYWIGVIQYTEQMHSDLPPTTLRGYVQLTFADTGNPIQAPNQTTIGGQQLYSVEPPHYLGPVVVAQKDRPVRVKFTNLLPTGTAGNLFLPVDDSIMGAGMGPLDANGNTCNPMTSNTCAKYSQNRATLHLHGGNTPWISDGTQHQWTTPDGESTQYPRGVSTKNVPDMVSPGSGSMTFYYTNQQSARLLFYHDHAYGITRLNVYAGEAAGYLVQDPTEQALVSNGTIPTDQIPLVLEDKTFVPDAAQLAATDPTWDTANWGGEGSLWLPHVYMPNQNPDDPSGANPMGRWDYGPWFWPPFTGLTNGPVPNPYYDPTNAPWEPAQIPGTPNPSIVPEAFMDTPVVNGTAYPALNVEPKAYRFRVLNAANDRYWNLSLWQAKSQAEMWNPDGTLADGNAGEVKMVPFNSSQNAITPFPASWYDGSVPNPFDDRVGGVPDPTTAGPQFVQIGTEGGFLPQAAKIGNKPINYVMNKRDITVGNIAQHALFLGPAERADVVVDFSQFAGQTLILYNDSPAPVPAGDPRYDYFTGDPDQTATGGAPSTLPGYGPNTRTVMQIHVGATNPTVFDEAALTAALPTAYAASQRKPLVPEPAYNAAFGASFPNALVRIQDTSFTFANGLYGLTGIKLDAGGSGYTSAPTVTIAGGGGTGATATAALAPSAPVGSLTLTNGGGNYTSAPSVTISGSGGAGATAAATLAATGSVKGVTITSGGSGYTSAPTVTFSAPPSGVGATGTAVISNKRVISVTITNAGSGYTSAPTITFSGGGGSGAAATATLGRAVAGLTLTNGGSGYTSPPTVSFSGGGGSGAAATAALAGRPVASVTLTSAGSGYISVPTVTITNGGGTGAAATASITVQAALEPKSIIEDFDPDYGRMNAMLGVEVPKTSANVQTSIPYYDIDPPTEVFTNTATAAPIGALGDGTQIWKITHNGVDTHVMHWHMFDVQIVNRVGWDGAIRPPEANETGWKDTIRMNPLEDIIVALRPIIPDVPFDLPNSIRPLAPTLPLGATNDPNNPISPFHGIDPTNEPAPVTNSLVNFGWEYVWHCHILGHEENIMMRSMAIAVAPRAPSNLTAASGRAQVTLRWTDNSINETGFVIERATASTGPWTVVTTTAANAVSYLDTPLGRNTKYFYRVSATNRVGYTQTYAAPVAGYPQKSASSAPTAIVQVTTG